MPLRLLGDDALLVRGAEAVSLSYDETRIARHGAMPAFVQESLFGHRSVHSLDGAEHRHRKATFVDVAYEDEQVERLSPRIDILDRGLEVNRRRLPTKPASGARVRAAGSASRCPFPFH